jgi:ribose-phosphate pyrophosphokinase
MIDSPRVCVLHGSASAELACAVAERLNIPVCKSLVSDFSDGETRVELQENMRGRDVYIIQSTSHPVNDHLMELMLMVDACRRASAANITVVVPYFGYARQDRRVRSSRVPISAKVVADMLQQVGMDRLVTVDLHADQIQGFFRVPVDNVYASMTLFDQDDLYSRVTDPLFVSPDVGGVVRARAIAKRFNQSDLAIIDKRRPKPNAVEVMNVIGDVNGRNCVIVDDIVDTAGTLCQAAKILKDQGAKSVYAYCVHPVLSGKALENIRNSELDEVVVSDTISLSDEAKKLPKIRQLSLAGVISQTLSRMNQKASVSSLFQDDA